MREPVPGRRDRCVFIRGGRLPRRIRTVAVTEDQTQAVELRALDVLDRDGRCRASALPGSAVGHQFRRRHVGREGSHVGAREIDGLLRDGAAFVVVARKQFDRRPTVTHGGDLPREIHGIPDARVEAVSAPRWVLMRGVADQVRAARAVRV